MRHVLAGLVLAIAALVVPVSATAQTYPTKPIRLIAPFPPGGTSDTIARVLGQKLTEAWKQQALVENRAGVAGSLGSSVAAKSPPDGYTLLVGNVGPVAVNHNVYKNVGYDPLKDFTPITLAVTAPQIVVVHPSVPAQTFKEFTALVKKHKGKINYGSSGPGSISHLSAELYKQMTGSDMLHVPFKGSALITTALLSGEVDVVFSDMAVVLPHVQAKKLRALAVTGPQPTPLVPGVPTVAASGVPGFAMTSWWGVLGPAGLQQPIVTRLNTELVRILRTDDVKQKFATLGVDAANSTPDEFSKLIRSEIDKYAKLVKSVGIQPQ
ncbi:MAG: Bug family tripartite tricarboxylate transporter substrate binding protein [Betaproteobacteria bacterium]